jgi:hypothetical protein
MKNGELNKDTERKLKSQLEKDTKIELHGELTKTLEDALNRKRKGDMIVNEWIKTKKKEFFNSKKGQMKENQNKQNFEKVKTRTNDHAFSEWLKNSLKSLRREKSVKRLEHVEKEKKSRVTERTKVRNQFE